MVECTQSQAWCDGTCIPFDACDGNMTRFQVFNHCSRVIYRACRTVHELPVAVGSIAFAGEFMTLAFGMLVTLVIGHSMGKQRWWMKNLFWRLMGLAHAGPIIGLIVFVIEYDIVNGFAVSLIPTLVNFTVIVYITLCRSVKMSWCICMQCMFRRVGGAITREASMGSASYKPLAEFENNLIQHTPLGGVI